MTTERQTGQSRSHAAGGPSMRAQECLPHRHYQGIADRLEQTLAMLPRDERSARLRIHIETAVETATELAYMRQSGLSLVYAKSNIGGEEQEHDV
jgi:hypothetical protein